MSYPDLQHEIAERVDPPGFDEVLARASGARRRRRTTIGAGLAAGVVVAGLAFAVGDTAGRDGRSDPAGPSRPWDGVSAVDPRLPAEVREILGSDHLQPWSVSTSNGAIAAVWAACDDQGACRFALVTEHDEEVHAGLLSGSRPSVTPLEDGWLLEDDDGLSRLTPDGERVPVVRIDGVASHVEAGDTLVHTTSGGFSQRGQGLLRGTKLLGAPAPDGATVQAAYVTPGGRLVATVTTLLDPFQLALSDPSSGGSPRLSSEEPAQTAYLQETGRSTGLGMVGHGDHVAIASYGDSPDGSIPLLAVEVSHDAGETWATVTDLDLEGADGVRDISGMVVSPEGTVFLTAESHGLVRIEAAGNATTVQMAPQHHSVVVLDDRVCMVSESGRVDHLQCSEDDGLTWTREPLPGFE